MKNKIKNIDELWRICKIPRDFKLIWVNGCFDLFHHGHLYLLESARKFCNKNDKLLVVLNSDKSVKLLKGEKRPIFNQKIRAEMLAALEVVTVGL